MSPSASQISLDRMVNAVEKVRQRLIRATAALKGAGIPYAVAGGNAVAAWVSSVDESAVRNTQDTDILVRRNDFDAVKRAMESAGFVYRHSAGLDVFLDGPNAKAREMVHVMVSETLPETREFAELDVVDIESLVRRSLTANRVEDRLHVRDLIDVGLVDQLWTERLKPELSSRLQTLLDTPEG